MIGQHFYFKHLDGGWRLVQVVAQVIGSVYRCRNIYTGELDTMEKQIKAEDGVCVWTNQAAQRRGS